MLEALIDSTGSFADTEGELSCTCGEFYFSAPPAIFSGATSVYGQANQYVDNTLAFQFQRAAILEPTRPEPDFSAIERPRSEKLPRLWQRAADQFVDRIAQDLDEDCTDPSGGVGLSSQAREACQRIASVLAGTVALQPGLKYASFVEEEGGTSLVLQSELSGRRANFRVSPDASQIKVVSVDAAGKSATVPVFLWDTATLLRFAEWVSKRD